MSCIVRKPDFGLCENKGADQLCSNCKADQLLCFLYTDRTISLLLKYKNFKLLACFCDCTGRFVSDLVGNPEDRFSHVAAHILVKTKVLIRCPKTNWLSLRFVFSHTRNKLSHDMTHLRRDARKPVFGVSDQV